MINILLLDGSFVRFIETRFNKTIPNYKLDLLKFTKNLELLCDINFNEKFYHILIKGGKTNKYLDGVVSKENKYKVCIYDPDNSHCFENVKTNIELMFINYVYEKNTNIVIIINSFENFLYNLSPEILENKYLTKGKVFAFDKYSNAVYLNKEGNWICFPSFFNKLFQIASICNFNSKDKSLNSLKYSVNNISSDKSIENVEFDKDNEDSQSTDSDFDFLSLINDLIKKP